MKHIIVFLYWFTTWVFKYVINFFELIFHLDFNHFSDYGTYFLSVSDIRDIKRDIEKNEFLKTLSPEYLNFVEKMIYLCVDS